jgi:hypothetical protein
MKGPKEKEKYIIVLASCQKDIATIGKVMRSFSTNTIASLKAAAVSTTFGDENT